MRLPISKLRDNPFRDFTLYPLDEDQVRRLAQSMKSVGFFSGISARPVAGGFYELAAGHHRKAAAKLAKVDEVEAIVENYSDEQMVQVMALENLAQRGHNAAAILDSVAAYSRLVTRQILLGEGVASKYLDATGSKGGGVSLVRMQQDIASDGPGMRVLYRAMNGFAKEARKENKDAENVTETDIQNAIATLKAGGVMGTLVVEVYASVEAIRAKRDAAAKAAAEREAKAEREAAAKAEREAEAKRRASEAAAKTKAAAAAGAKAKAASAARQAEADRKAAEKESKAAAERVAATEKKEREEAERLEREREAVAALATADAPYDIHCVACFEGEGQEVAFREAVTSPTGLEYIRKDEQLALAKLVRADIDEIKKRRGMKPGPATVRSITFDHIMHVVREQKNVDADEQARVLKENLRDRIDERWKTIRRGMLQAEGALLNLIEDQKAWPPDEPFPYDMEVIDRITEVGRRFEALRQSVKGNSHGPAIAARGSKPVTIIAD